jgi:N-acyl-D-amino-acid deacylase
MYDLLLKGGTVVDGTGDPAYRGDVAVKAGKIVAVGDLGQAEATRTVDCSGRCVSPGWADFHGHADWSVLDHPVGLNLLVQGCTLTVSGNCGLGAAPTVGRAVDLYRRGEGKGYNTATIDAMAKLYPEMRWSFADFMEQVERARVGVNFAQLAAHNVLRRCVMGHDRRAASPDEVQQMKALLEECLDQGAFGLTSGLVYIPGCWAETSELIELCKLVARRDGFYASHIRGERETNLQATQEVVETAEKSGVRANISHMQSKYPVYGNGWQKIEMLTAARHRGVDVSCDYEVYNMNGGSLQGFLQIHFLTREQLLQKLQSREGRAELKRTMWETDPWHPQGRFGPGGVPFRRAWDRVVIWDCPHDRSLQGKSVAAVAALRGIEPEECLFDLTLAEEGRGPRMINDYIEDEHYRIIPCEHCILPSIDTGLFDPAGRFQPIDFRYQLEVGAASSIGVAPRVLGQFVREERIFSLEEGVRRMTSLPISRLGITDRGVVRPGLWADLVVFDKDTVGMRSEQADPNVAETCWPAGIDYVVVNGQVAMEGHRHTGVRAGKVLRKQ